jgi:hypothetical protein
VSAAAQAEPLRGEDVVRDAIADLRPGPDGGVVISAVQASRCEGAIGRLESARDLHHVAKELLHLARFLDVEKGSRGAAEIVSGLAALAARGMLAARKKIDRSSEALAPVARQYRSFKAARAAFAPMIGERSPEGSISAQHFQGPRKA